MAKGKGEGEGAHLRRGVVIEAVGAHDGCGEGEEVGDTGELLHLHGSTRGGGGGVREL